ncbi:MAG: NAD(P) transhydrogenase subunit alpha [Thermoleophilaceae bacterium]
MLAEFTVFALAVVIGFELIARVPSLLHTPLMSATNAIHGIVLVGAIIALAGAGEETSILTKILGMIAVIFGAINVVGGFLVTNRMLDMFSSQGRGRGSGK